MTDLQNKAVGGGDGNLIRCLSGIDGFLGGASRFSRWLNTTALVIFFLMMCLTFVDVLLRYIFSVPIVGSKEYTEVMLILVISFTIAYTYDQKSHVKIDIVTAKLQGQSKVILETITAAIGTGLFAIVTWRSVEQLLFFLKISETHGTSILIPAAPFQCAIVLGSATLLLLIFRDLARNIEAGLRLHLKAPWWLLIIVVLAAVVTLSYFWLQPDLWPISLPVVGIIGVVVMLLLMFTGMPTAFALMITGFLMIGHIRGPATAFDVVATQFFSSSSNYLWSVAGFFILMGYLCLHARFGEDIYVTFNRWLGHLRGGLATATIVASTALAGIVGDSLSVTTTMGTIAFPQMKKYKYSDKLSTGTIAAGATIGPLIPPSLGFIIYGTLTGLSIGKLFIAGIIPGLLLGAFFILTIFIQCRINPTLGPQGPKSSWGERFGSLKYGGPIVVLFLLVIGGIYAGIFTATEGGAIGCTGALIIGLIMKRFNRRNFTGALVDAGKVIGMIFLVIIGSTVFSRFVAWCNLSGLISDFFNGLALSPKLLILFMLAVFFMLGFFIDILPMLLIGVPVFHPVAVALGVDPVWFAVMLVIVIQVGVITPPFATILFAIKGIIPDVHITTIFSGVMPFVLATAVVVILIFLIPPMVTWLPNLLY